MVTGLIGTKVDQAQKFLQDGTRVPVSSVLMKPNVVVQVKTMEKEGYNSIQFGIGLKKNADKPTAGHIKKAGILKTPRFLREIRVDNPSEFKTGDLVKAEDIFSAGDIVDVIGTSKGKGYAGVVKRHHFRGGPRTHGQSDRERAPGSIGQTTTPGRVYKGKRMAGKMGNERVTVKNLQVLDVRQDLVLIKGLIPGVRKGLVMLKKAGKDKKFVPLFQEIAEEKPGDKKAEKTNINSKPEEKTEVISEAAVETKIETSAKEQSSKNNTQTKEEDVK